MSWKFVFNTAMKPFLYPDKESAAIKAKECGYKFFIWNGKVLSVTYCEETGINVDDLI